MRILLAKFFRFLFKSKYFKTKFFGIHQRIFEPYNLFKGVVQKVDYHGFQLTLHLDDWIQENIYFLGEYEKAELKTLDHFLKEDSVFLDLGANLGLFTLHASQRIGNNGKIVSFEPFSTNNKALVHHLSDNHITNVTVEKLAVGEQNGTITLYYDEKEANLGMVSAKPVENAQKEEVEIVSIDSYFQKNPLSKVDFIKIDIEGFEYPTLLGMESTLKQFYPTLLIELLSDSSVPNTGDKVESLLTNLGYKKFFITDEGTLSTTATNQIRMNYLFTTDKV